MRLFSQEELQRIWTLYLQVGKEAKERSFFIKETFPNLFNEEGALPISDALDVLKKEIEAEFDNSVEEGKYNPEDEEEVLYLRFLQRDLLKPKGDNLFTFKKLMGIIIVSILVYLALRGS